jgi:hypothetical protein
LDCGSLLQLSDHSLLWSTALNLTRPQAPGLAAGCLHQSGSRLPQSKGAEQISGKAKTLFVPDPRLYSPV